MTLEDLQRFDLELQPLVPLEGACTFALESARSFNADANDLRSWLVESVGGLVEKGRVDSDLASCLERTVAELAFWRRVLLKLHPGDFASAPSPPDFLVGYLLS
jgi:hypothetical protein